MAWQEPQNCKPGFAHAVGNYDEFPAAQIPGWANLQVMGSNNLVEALQVSVPDKLKMLPSSGQAPSSLALEG